VAQFEAAPAERGRAPDVGRALNRLPGRLAAAPRRERCLRAAPARRQEASCAGGAVGPRRRRPGRAMLIPSTSGINGVCAQEMIPLLEASRTEAPTLHINSHWHKGVVGGTQKYTRTISHVGLTLGSNR
jgi:hypothetical protein